MEILNDAASGNDRLICTCHGVCAGEARKAIQEGAATVKACFRALGRWPKCGNCVVPLRDLLAEAQDAKTRVEEDTRVGWTREV